MSDVKLSQEQIRSINETIRYTMFSVFNATMRFGRDADRAGLVEAALSDIQAATAGTDITIRGWYDLAGMRGDSDVMVWWHAESIEALQAAYRAFQRSDLGSYFDQVWSAAAVHRPAEFNRGHVPAFLADERAHAYVCVYPFVRSYDWYTMDPDDRRRILAEHGRAARDFPDVRANTVNSFALNDYEWVLAFEADELIRIVDLMRELRATEARNHVRVEIPFFTGPRRELHDIVADLA